MSAPLELALVTDSRAFEALQHEWRLLAESAREPHMFRSFSWCWNAWRIVAEPRGYALRLLTGRVAGVLVLVWPMMEKDHVLRMVSAEILEYRDLLVRESPLSERWIDEAWQFVQGRVRADLMMFQNLRMPNFVAARIASRRGAHAIGGGWCPVIRLDRFEDWDAYARTLPKSLSNDQRRQWKRVRLVLPDLEFQVVDNAAEIAPTLEWITRHKIAWAKKCGRIVWHESDAVTRLLVQVAHDHLAMNRLVLAKLAADGTVVSAGFGYVYAGEFHFHVFAYDDAYATYSPSRLFLESIVRWCIGHGVHTFDFMPGDEPYKRIWATDYVRTASYIAPGTLKGAACLALSEFVTLVARKTPHVARPVDRLAALTPRGIRSAVRRMLARASFVKELALVKHALELRRAPEDAPEDPVRAATAGTG